VEIILANNGFQVVNLGIKIPPEQLVAAVREHRPDILGLSGLLVKSAQQMVTTAQDLSRAGVNLPVLVGGAALSRNFVDRSIAPAYAGTVAYAQDAMSGLELAKQIVDPAGLDKLKDELRVRREKLAQETANRPAPVVAPPAARSTEIRVLDTVPPAPDFERHVLTNTPLEQIWRFVNPVMLYGRHFGVKGSAARALDTPGEALLAQTEDGRKALALKETLDALKQELLRGGMEARAVFRFFKAGSQGNTLRLFDGQTGAEATSFDFPRQPRAGGVCLADFVRPLGPRGEPSDNVSLFLVTAGKGIRELADRFKAQGDFVKMHGVQALALETAEAYAELLHSRIRSMWGSPDRPDLTMLERFRASTPEAPPSATRPARGWRTSSSSSPC
jgi:5-methyltetrahydrofolate--homocysteine methyltransferase